MVRINFQTWFQGAWEFLESLEGESEGDAYRSRIEPKVGARFWPGLWATDTWLSVLWLEGGQSFDHTVPASFLWESALCRVPGPQAHPLKIFWQRMHPSTLGSLLKRPRNERYIQALGSRHETHQKLLSDLPSMAWLKAVVEMEQILPFLPFDLSICHANLGKAFEPSSSDWFVKSRTN